MAQEEKKKKLNIDLPEELASGTYSNLAVITHSPVEFVVDFAQVMPGMNQAQVRSRIILANSIIPSLDGEQQYARRSIVL